MCIRDSLRSLATVAGLGTISCSSDIVRFVQGGVVKIFRCATQSNEFRDPYDSPQQSVDAAPPSVLLWSVGCVFGTAFIGGVLGALLGAVLGSFSPGYYRSVFSNGDSPNFDPVSVGIGQGLTQGVVFGTLIGLALVGMFYWYRSRIQNHS